MKTYDDRFDYTPSISTNVVSTWKRFGFKPTTAAERLARQRRAYADEPLQPPSASVTTLVTARRKLHHAGR